MLRISLVAGMPVPIYLIGFKKPTDLVTGGEKWIIEFSDYSTEPF